MGKYYILHLHNGGERVTSSVPKYWIANASLQTARAMSVGAIAVDALCVKQILKSNMKNGFKIIGVTALGSRMVVNGKAFVHLCKNYKIAYEEDDAGEQAEDTETAEPEQNPEEETEENKSE